MKFLKISNLAFRNLFRNMRRTMFTFGAVSIGLFIAIIAISANNGLEHQMLETVIRTRTAHLKLYEASYDYERSELDHLINGYPEKLAQLKSNPKIKSLSARLSFSARLTDGLEELVCLAIGIDPEMENSVFKRRQATVEGEYLQLGEDSILLSQQIAKLFKVKVGDQLTVVSRTPSGTINAIDVSIKGLSHTNNPEVDNFMIFMPIDTAQKFLDLQSHTVSEIAILGLSAADSDSLADSLQVWSKSKGLQLKTWKVLTSDLRHLIDIRKRARGILTSIFLLIAAAGITNTILMATYERTREIGMLMALGLKSQQIAYLFLLESGFIGALGGVLSCLIGGGLIYYFQRHGINVSLFSRTDSQFPIQSTIYPYINLPWLIFILFLGVAVAVVAGLYPAIRASKLEPVKALKG
jgi:putative ABC transport system permease protein